MHRHRIVAVVLLTITAMPLSAEWKKAYFAATPAGSWARYSDTTPQSKMTTTMTRLPDGEDGGPGVELLIEFGDNQYPPVHNRYTLPKEFPLDRKLIDFMSGINGGSLVAGEGEPMELDAATVEALVKNSASYEATAKFKKTETIDGRKADRYGYTIRWESPSEAVPSTTESGDLWLSADVPFGVVKQTSVTKDDAGNVTMQYERVLVGSGTKKTD